MRIARVNITVPDDRLERSRAAGLDVSRVASGALSEEPDRRAKLAALERYPHELEHEMGPTSGEEREAAGAWADLVLDDVRRRKPGRSRRST